jgi:hypothetical protein
MEFITLATPAEHMPAIDELRKVRLSTVLDFCARLLGLDVCGCGKLLFATTTWLRAPGAMSALLLCDWMLLNDVTTQTSSVIRLCLFRWCCGYTLTSRTNRCSGSARLLCSRSKSCSS